MTATVSESGQVVSLPEPADGRRHLVALPRGRAGGASRPDGFAAGRAPESHRRHLVAVPRGRPPRMTVPQVTVPQMTVPQVTVPQVTVPLEALRPRPGGPVSMVRPTIPLPAGERPAHLRRPEGKRDRRGEAVSPNVLFLVSSGPAGKDHRPAVAVVAAILVLLAVCGGGFAALSSVLS